MKKLKVGIIGFGKMGKIRLDALEKSGRAKVIAIFDPNPIKNLNKTISIVSSAALVLEQAIDAVFICTPNNFIKPFTLLALEKGIHVFFGTKRFVFYPHKLMMKTHQTWVWEKQGIPAIQEEAIYDISRKKDVVLHLRITGLH